MTCLILFKNYHVSRVAMLTVLIAIFTYTLAYSQSAEYQSPSQSLAETPGVKLSKLISKTTGLQLSPVMSAGAMGAYEYYMTPQSERQRLSWHAGPIFWVPLLFISAIYIFNGTIGSHFPIVSKPISVIKSIEHKLTAVAISAPIIMSDIIRGFSGSAQKIPGQSGLMTPQYMLTGLFPLDSENIYYAIGFIAIGFSYIFVWLLSHALDTLVLISPVPLVDWAINIIKLFVLGLIALSALVNPWLGLVVSIVIVLFAWSISGWCFRLSVFGSVIAWDILTRRHHKSDYSNDNAVKAFLSRKLDNFPKRSYGALHKDATGLIIFSCRPWFIMPERSVKFPKGEYSIVKGFIYPSISLNLPEKDRLQNIAVLPPRYKNHEAVIGAMLGIQKVQESALVRGFVAAVQWIQETFLNARDVLADRIN